MLAKVSHARILYQDTTGPTYTTNEMKVCLSPGPASNAAPNTHADTHTRISLPCYPYTPASSARPHTSLLSCYLRSQFALPHVAAIVVLGGTWPLSFLEDPNHFVIWVKRCVKGGRAREREVTVGNTLTRNAVRLFLCGPSPPPAVPTFSPSSW